MGFFPLCLTKDVVKHARCTAPTSCIFQLQTDHKGTSDFSDFTPDERTINSLAHENACKIWLLTPEKAMLLKRSSAEVTNHSLLFQTPPSPSYDSTGKVNFCDLD